MKTLTVLELSKLYNINRQTIYNNIKKGILSKNSENKIDLAEAIRVFGEPIKKQDVKESVKIESQNSAEVLLLRQQIDMLKNQLNDAKDRESFYQNQIETMQRLLEAPKTQLAVEVDDSNEYKINPNTASKYDELTTPVQAVAEAPKPVQKPVPEPKKRGLFERMLNAVLSDA